MTAKKEVYLAETIEMGELEHPELEDATTIEASSATTAEAADSRRPDGDEPKKPLITDQVRSWFAACARCSFFLAGYRLQFNRTDSGQAAAESMAGWLSLGWNQSVCELLRKSYGSQLDMDCFHYEGVCPECHRLFIYHVAEGELKGQFQIELKPQTGR